MLNPNVTFGLPSASVVTLGVSRAEELFRKFEQLTGRAAHRFRYCPCRGRDE